MKKLSVHFDYSQYKQKGIIHIPILLIILVVAGFLALFLLNKDKLLFFENKGGFGTRGTAVQIPPSQLMPFVSAKEARKTICNLKKEELFAQVCQSKYDTVTKDDGEKIVELFALIEEIKNDKSISDYERLLLSQAVFAALPIGDNPENSESFNLNQQSLLSRLKDYLTSQTTVYAKEQIMSEEEFRDLMKKDLQNMVDSLPKGDNAWVINVMVSKYSWKDGKAQPLYSHQYLEVFNPFPNNPNVNTKDITYHIQARVGSKASSQTVDSEMIAYSFTIQSWKSQEYTSKEELVDEKFLVRKRNRSDSSYQGEPYLNNLLDAVKMPSTRRPAESPDKDGQTDQMKGEPRDITCEEFKKMMAGECPAFISSEENPTGDSKIWCFSDAEFDDYDFMYDAAKTQPPDYTMKSSESKKCKEYLNNR